MRANLVYLVKADQIVSGEPEAWAGPVLVQSRDDKDWVDFFPADGPYHKPLLTLYHVSRVLFGRVDFSFIVQGYDQGGSPHKFYSLLLTQKTKQEWEGKK